MQVWKFQVIYVNCFFFFYIIHAKDKNKPACMAEFITEPVFGLIRRKHSKRECNSKLINSDCYFTFTVCW